MSCSVSSVCACDRKKRKKHKTFKTGTLPAVGLIDKSYRTLHHYIALQRRRLTSFDPLNFTSKAQLLLLLICPKIQGGGKACEYGGKFEMVCVSLYSIVSNHRGLTQSYSGAIWTGSG